MLPACGRPRGWLAYPECLTHSGIQQINMSFAGFSVIPQILPGTLLCLRSIPPLQRWVNVFEVLPHPPHLGIWLIDLVRAPNISILIGGRKLSFALGNDCGSVNISAIMLRSSYLCCSLIVRKGYPSTITIIVFRWADG